MHKSWIQAAVRAVLLVIGFAMGASGAHLTLAQEGVPSYETTECPFNAAANVECGFVTVREDRSAPESGTIRIATVILEGDVTDAPVMLLSGGPGEITTPSAGVIGSVFQGIVGGRTLILFDQRGVGRSEPALNCPEWIETQLELLAPETTPEEVLVENNAALVACANRLEAEGINLDAYNSLENAADVADIVTALGYDQVNLMGVSYGSLLAQHVLRDYPEVVRAAVIDSVLPLDASFFVGTSDTATAAFQRLFDECAADPACDAAYPDLGTTLRETIAYYNENPLAITITDPTTGIEYPSVLTGDTILSAVVFNLYMTPQIPVLPEIITDLAAGDLDVAETVASQYIAAFYALDRGMQYSVQCAEDLLTVTEEDLLERYSALPPEYRGRADLEVIMENSPFDLCAQWPIETLDISVKEPLETDIPVLALGGEYDPVTPPGYAARVTENLENAFTYSFPGVGHSVTLASPCAASIVAQFLDDPTTAPDASCIDELGVTFRVPGQAVSLEPFTSETFGISGVIPEGWQELAPGTYAESMAGTVVIIQQAAPVAADELQALLAQQFGIEAFPEASNTVEANGLTWSLYETTGPQGLLADVALAEADGTTYVIVLLSGTTDRGVYYEGAFLPAIDALTIE